MSYNAPPPPPPPGGYPYYQAPQDHPKATTVLILGILGIIVCGVCAPFAWVMGNRVVREIDASNGAYGGRSNANIGRILGIVGSVLMALGLVLVLGLFALGIFAASTSTQTCTTITSDNTISVDC